MEALDQDLGVIIPVDVLIDVFNDLSDGHRFLSGDLDVKVGRVLEIFNQRAVETIEDGKFFFVDEVAFSRAPSEHLHPEDPGFDGAQENDELQARNIDPGGEHIDGHHDFRVRPVSELPYLLQGPVHRGASGDLLDKSVALTEFLPADSYDLVGVRGVGQIVGGKDERFGKTPVFLFVGIGISGDFLDDLSVAVRER